MKATTINSVDRRIGRRGLTGTDMNPTRGLCFCSGGSGGALGAGAVNPLGTDLAPADSPSVPCVPSGGPVMTGPDH